MLKEDKDKIKDLLMNYPCKEVMKQFSAAAIEVAGEVSDAGAQEMAKELVKFSVALDDLISGRPYLV